jgi:hypothetical protein
MTNTPNARRVCFFVLATAILAWATVMAQEPTPTPQPPKPAQSPTGESQRSNTGNVGRIIVGTSSNHDVSSPLTDLEKNTTPATRQPVSVEKLEQPELRYRLLHHFPSVQFCDPYCIPSCRPDVQDALTAFPEIRKDEATFAAITQHLGLKAKTEFTEADKATIYREYRKLLVAVRLEPAQTGYEFELDYFRDIPWTSPHGIPDRREGHRVTGIIVPPDKITVISDTPARLGCPI